MIVVERSPHASLSELKCAFTMHDRYLVQAQPKPIKRRLNVVLPGTRDNLKITLSLEVLARSLPSD